MKEFSFTTEAFAKLLSSTFEKETITPEKSRYVIYARKSTDDKGKQIRSIEDQISECQEYADRMGLKVEKVEKELMSAKESGTRKVFYEILNHIQSKDRTYEAILTWHPDRLARNMKDAGEVMDLLDKHIITDLKFVSFSFNNDTSGKMMLSILFALAKEFSDKLGDDVTRGNTRILQEGKAVSFGGYGYYKDTNAFRKPDGENFKIIQSAFKLRLEGKTFEQIAYFINTRREYGALHSQTTLPKFNKQSVARMMENSLYAGVNVHGKIVTDLSAKYNFVPMVTVEEFTKINEKDGSLRIQKVLKSIQREGVKADLLRGCIFCDGCKFAMTAGLTPKKTKDGVTNYFYYRCDTKGCEYRSKSLRAKEVVNFATDYIEKYFKPTTDTWLHFKEEMRNHFELARRKNLSEQSALLAKHRSLLERQNDIKEELLAQNRSEKVDKSYLQESLRADYESIQAEITHLELKLADFKQKNKEKLKILEEKEFIELIQNLPSFIRNITDIGILDQTLRKIFLNFFVTPKSVVNTTLNTPFDSLFVTKVSLCALHYTLSELVLHRESISCVYKKLVTISDSRFALH